MNFCLVHDKSSKGASLVKRFLSRLEALRGVALHVDYLVACQAAQQRQYLTASTPHAQHSAPHYASVRPPNYLASFPDGTFQSQCLRNRYPWGLLICFFNHSAGGSMQHSVRKHLRNGQPGSQVPVCNSRCPKGAESPPGLAGGLFGGVPTNTE